MGTNSAYVRQDSDGNETYVIERDYHFGDGQLRVEVQYGKLRLFDGDELLHEENVASFFRNVSENLP